MGVHLDSHLLRLMSVEDQARYGGSTGVTNTRNTGATSRKRDADERKEQGDFTNWLLLQNSQGRKIPFSWHATHTRSKATPGTPDFWVGVCGRGIWFGFKKDQTCRLSDEQEQFRLACAAQGIEHHVVHSAAQAIEIVATMIPINR
jgi:hypothetical protein